MRIRIQEDERGLLFHYGNYVRKLSPGIHYFLPFSGYSIEKFNLALPFLPSQNLNLFRNDEKLMQELHFIDVADKQIVLHYQDGHFYEVLAPGRYAFWKKLVQHDFHAVDLTETEVPEKFYELFHSLQTSPLHTYCQQYVLEEYEEGLLFYNGAFQKKLSPGKYFFWNNGIAVSIKKVDKRQQQIDVLGQELLTADKISLRLNFICHYKIIDAEKVLLNIKSYEEQIYILLQLILREYIGSLKFDELLLKKQEIANYVLGKLADDAPNFGLHFTFAGVKDIILPGEIREILNTVLIAEKKAQANIITRREETASTRSLLNTAKLMDDNPTLYRLKELEYIEKLSERINNISIGSKNGNLIENISQLLQTPKS
ncbi:MAG: SPFH domain-containing protein [Spirochaetota bacterium]